MPNAYTPQSYGPGVSPLGSALSSFGQNAEQAYRAGAQQRLAKMVALHNMAMQEREQSREDVIAGLGPDTASTGGAPSVGGPTSTDMGSGLASPNSVTTPPVLRGSAGGLAGALTPSGPGANLPGIGGVGQGAQAPTAPGATDDLGIQSLISALSPHIDTSSPYARSYAGRSRIYQNQAEVLASLMRTLPAEMYRAQTAKEEQQNLFAHQDQTNASLYGAVDPTTGTYSPGLRAQSTLAASGPANALRAQMAASTESYRQMMARVAQQNANSNTTRAASTGAGGIDQSPTNPQGFRTPTKTDISSITTGMNRYRNPPLGSTASPVASPDSARFMATGDRNAVLSGLGEDTLANPLPKSLPMPPTAAAPGPGGLGGWIQRHLSGEAPKDAASANALPGGLTSQSKQPVTVQQGGRVVANQNTAPPTIGLPVHPAGPSGGVTAAAPKLTAAQIDSLYQEAVKGGKDPVRAKALRDSLMAGATP